MDSTVVGSTALALPPRRGESCLICRQRVYLVRNALGEVFYVTHTGKRWCPLRAHRAKQGSTKQRRKKRR